VDIPFNIPGGVVNYLRIVLGYFPRYTGFRVIYPEFIANREITLVFQFLSPYFAENCRHTGHFELPPQRKTFINFNYSQ
jgi:hypothetical protein